MNLLRCDAPSGARQSSAHRAGASRSPRGPGAQRAYVIGPLRATIGEPQLVEAAWSLTDYAASDLSRGGRVLPDPDMTSYLGACNRTAFRRRRFGI